MNMRGKALVAYATKHGATKEIAERIGEALGQEGVPTDVLPVELAVDLRPYTAIVLGSAVYVGQWQKEAVEFLEQHVTELAERSMWIFSSGPLGQGDPIQLLNGWRLPTAQLPLIDRIRPKDVAVFQGSVNIKQLGYIERWMLQSTRAPIGDFRNWDAISAWARSIAGQLKTRRIFGRVGR
jgi:menaquinone-dependent protoporphyrinogen oxidase